MKAKKIIGVALIAIIGGLVAVFVYSKVIGEKEKLVPVREVQRIQFAKMQEDFDDNQFNFTYAAEKTIHTVVHVKTQSQRERYYRNPLHDFFYGDRYTEPQPVLGFGSGVIVSIDGYIVTNNHVIENSDYIEVVLNDRRSYEAELVGADPSTDVALLKIDEKNLPYISYGNSDDLKIGEWVLAVGNPYNMTSTVTAGIVSAKARNLNILTDQFPIESYIQTDAAVNRGNSGGALVNTRGELVGINSAIQSPTGAYSGNSFAIPVNIVKKIVADIIEFGEVQRAILGVTIEEVTAKLAEEKKLDEIEGVYINGMREDGAAKDAGIEVGDVIIKINDIYVNQVPELQEQISKFRPNDKVNVTIKRRNNLKQFKVTLRNMQGDTRIIRSDEIISVLGAKFEELTDKNKRSLGIKHGLKIVDLESGKFKDGGIKKGFVITSIQGKPVDEIMDIQKIINSRKKGVDFEVEGLYPGGRYMYVYIIPMD